MADPNLSEPNEVSRQADALGRGLVAGVGSDVHAVRIAGADAVAWLHDLLTADIASLEPGRARRALLLTPTGRIRADVRVVRDVDACWLLQPASQRERIGDALAIYVLSSDVVIDAERPVTVISLLGDGSTRAVPRGSGVLAASPSWLGDEGGGGVDVIVFGSGDAVVEAALQGAGRVGAPPDVLETLRVRRGIARMGVDFAAGALPAEAGLEHAIDVEKGCFLGQESVARVRSLGHPPTVLFVARVAGHVAPGDVVVAGGRAAGEVTSAAPDDDGTTATIGRIPWGVRDLPISTPDGRAFLQVGRPG